MAGTVAAPWGNGLCFASIVGSVIYGFSRIGSSPIVMLLPSVFTALDFTV
jgi:hypothetical protein